MIVPMRKYSFLVYHGDYEKFLTDIREIGVLHVMERPVKTEDEEIKQKYQQLTLLNKTKRFLAKQEPDDTFKIDASDGIEMAEKILDFQNKVERLEQRNISLNRDISYMKPWGNFSFASVNRLKEAGIYTHFMQCSSKKFNDEWREKYPVEIIDDTGSRMHFVIFSRNEEPPVIEADIARLSSQELNEITREKEEIEEEIEEINHIFRAYAAKEEVLDASMNQVTGELEYKNVVKNTAREAESKLLVLEGYVPLPEEEKLKDYLDKASVYYVDEEVKQKEDREAPVLLKNNKFSRLFEPIGNLFSLPAYQELDLTPFFAPFFMLFFGFCLGDAGYGLFLLVGLTIAKFKVKPEWKPILTLGQYLGAATILMGILGGSFFGINLIEDTNLPFKEFMLKPEQMFYLSIGIGLFQIIFGMIIRVVNSIKQKGFVYGLSTMGWLIILLSSIVFLGGDSLGWFAFGKLKSLFYICLGIGGFLVVAFNDPNASIFVRPGLAIWDAYQTVTGIFGDMLSYIRLFALGMSSAILGHVFNTISAQFLNISYIGWLFFLILLVFGHTLNLSLAALGSFVHPMRLTFVEFYKNAGFAGGGKEYKPFKIKK